MIGENGSERAAEAIFRLMSLTVRGVELVKERGAVDPKEMIHFPCTFCSDISGAFSPANLFNL